MIPPSKNTSAQPSSKGQTIIYAGGHSAGHIMPLVALAHKNNQATRKIIVSTHHLKRYTTADQRIIFNKIITLPLLKTTGWKARLSIGFMLIYHFVMAFRLCLTERPDKVISTGGFFSIPLCLVARLFRIPIDLYELNAEYGRAIQFLLPYASSLSSPFPYPNSPAHPPHHLIEYPRIPMPHHTTARSPHDNSECVSLLVLGGSQGSRDINALVRHVLEEQHFQDMITITHQTGDAEYLFHKSWYGGWDYTVNVIPFSSDVHTEYMKADLVIARAGAGTLFDLVHYQKRSIIIPLITPSTMHQVTNARALHEAYPHLFTVCINQPLHVQADEIVREIEYQWENKMAVYRRSLKSMRPRRV